MHDFSDKSIKYGDNEHSRLSGIISRGKWFLRMSSKRVQYHMWEAKNKNSDYDGFKLRLSHAELMFGSILIMLDICCWKKLANNKQRTKSGWSGRCLVWVLPNKVKDNL